MKIRRKISVIYSVITTIVLLCFSFFIYFFSGYYVRNDFYGRLEEKAYFIADKYFEEDEMSHKLYEETMEKNSKTLPEANIVILDTKYRKLVSDSLKKVVPEEVANRLIAGHNTKFSIKEKQGVGLFYPDNQGTFIIVVTAIDRVGIRRQQNLLKSLGGILIVSIFFIYFIGQLYARQVLSPISNILKEVKRIRATNLKRRLLESEGTDELSELIRMLNQMLDRLEHSFDMQKNFISNASHELKNPLTAIMGEAEISLSKTRSVDQYINSLLKINDEAERLDIITRNLLNLAQADFEITEQNREEIQLDELLYEIGEYFGKSKYLNRIVFHISDLQGTSKSFTVYGIHNLLQTALTNVLENALKFSMDEPVDVSLKEKNRTIILTVSDKGIGIPENERKDLFQPFFRATNAYTYKGSGIGLALAHKIIRLHGGTIDIHSSPGTGTIVEIQISSLLNKSGI
ncbi:MAG: ATP-binding protein [Bacteroidales bacterium]|jgi:signal transduction histidine kinase